MKFLRFQIYLFIFIFIFIFIFSFFVVHGANAATQVYYSVGQNTNDHSSGGNVSVTSGVATFTVAQTATNLGVGDKLIAGGNTYYLASKTDTTHWNVVTNLGAIPSNIGSTAVTSITHTFSSLSAAVSGANGASYLNTLDLVAGNYQLNIPCYYDSGADTSHVDVNNWVVASTNYIKIYTPNNILTEVNQSQRHSGKWDDGKFSWASGAYQTPISVTIPYIKIVGLQIYNTYAAGNGIITNVEVQSSGITISDNVIKGTNGEAINASTNSNFYIYDNIIYDCGVGVSLYRFNSGYVPSWIVYNNTINNCTTGIRTYTQATAIVKNNIVQNSTIAYSGTFNASSTNNISQDATSPNAALRNKTVSFVDAPNKDFHLASTDTAAKNAGVDLSADANLPFPTDIDGQNRHVGSWDIGADETTRSVYFSVGQNTTDHKIASNVTVSGTTATFTVAQTATNMGVGDVIDYDTDHKLCYIYGKTSGTVWSCTNATGGTPTAANNVVVNSISHVFNSLSAALPSGAGGAKTLLGNSDLTALNVQLNIPCYYDTGADTAAVTIDGFTTDAMHYIKIYTPNNISTEVNVSQRHAGKWDDGKYALKVTSSSTSQFNAVTLLDNDIYIEGLQIQNNKTATGAAMGISFEAANDYNLYIAANIIRGPDSLPTDEYRRGLSSNAGTNRSFKIWNNVIYGWGMLSTQQTCAVIFDSATNGYVYFNNNTLSDCTRGVVTNGNGDNYFYAKNNILNNVNTPFYSSNPVPNATNNVTTSGALYYYGGYQANHAGDKVNQSLSFIDAPNKDFHLSPADTAAKNAGANLYADANLPITTDLDGQARPNSATLFDIGADEAANSVFYSVGQSTADLSNNGSSQTCTIGINCTVSISSGIATFNFAQTGNIGVGDRVTYNTSSIIYISGKISETKWQVVTATGATPADVGAAVILNSITREFTSLSAAVTAASNASHINNTNLVTANVVLNIPCYYDTGADPNAVTINNYTTKSNNYIKIYTPNNTSTEANISQRHSGIWNASKYNLTLTTGMHILTINSSYVRLDGIQAYINNAVDWAYIVNIATSENSGNIKISNSIFRSNSYIHRAITDTLSTSPGLVLDVWNNVMHDFGSTAGTYPIGAVKNTRLHLYNNTILGGEYGVRQMSPGVIIAKNNIVQGAGDGFSGAFDSASNYNISSIAADAPGANSKNSTTVKFVDAVNKNFHLDPSDTAAKNAGTDLQRDDPPAGGLAFDRDIDGQVRTNPWDIGADQFFDTVVQTEQDSPSLDAGLVGYWTFDGDDISGAIAKDISGNNNDGTINGATVTPGKLGQGLNYGSAGNVVTVPDSSALDGMAQITVGAWIYPRSSGIGTSYGRIIDKQTGNVYGLYFNASNIVCELNGGVISSGSPFSGKFNQWHHVVCAYDGANVNVYIDNVVVANGVQTGNIGNTTSNLYIGNAATGDRTFNGKIDDVRIYNRALGVSEIGQLYHSGEVKMQTSQNDKLTDGLVGLWSFDGKDISGTTAFDRSGNGNNGTISGATVVPGKVGQGMNFNGATSFINAGSAVSLDNIENQGGNGMTIGAWIKPRSAGVSSYGTIFNKGFSDGSLWLTTVGSGRISFTRDYSTIDLGVLSNDDTYYLNQWQLLAVTWDGSNNASGVHIYKDGIERTKIISNDGVGSKISDAGNDLQIGNVSGYAYDGLIDEVRTYNRVLSANEILELYNSGKVEIRK